MIVSFYEKQNNTEVLFEENSVDTIINLVFTDIYNKMDEISSLKKEILSLKEKANFLKTEQAELKKRLVNVLNSKKVVSS